MTPVSGLPRLSGAASAHQAAIFSHSLMQARQDSWQALHSAWCAACSLQASAHSLQALAQTLASAGVRAEFCALGALGHAGVALGELANAVVQAHLTGAQAVGGGQAGGVIGVGRGLGGSVVAVLVLFGGDGGSRQGGKGDGSGAAHE